LRILSVAVGEPDPLIAQWVRLVSIAEGLRNKGNDVKLVSFVKTPSDSHGASSLNGLDCKLVPLLRWNVFHNISTILNEYKPDLVYANTHLPALLFALSRFKQKPLILDMHGFIVDEKMMLAKEKGSFSLWLQIMTSLFLESLAIMFSSKIICVSQNMIHYLNQVKKVQRDKMAYVTNGVDLNFFRSSKSEEVLALRRKLGFDDKLIFGYIGNFEQWQGVENFIAAASLAGDKEMGFLVVGGVDSYVKENIVRLRKIPRNRMPLYYSACDVLVLPRPEHMATEVAAPTKFAEYTAMSKPVLVTNVGDAALFVKKYRCGIVVTDNKPETLKEAFYAFKELSECELRKMGKNSRRLADTEFDWKKILTKLNLILEKLA
jgi:glycosyltransferase involved in cell wall biosynthesis